MKPQIHVLKLRNVPIFRQLQIEEAMLRVDKRNWFIWNEDMQTGPTVVLGMSGKPEKMVNADLVRRDSIPLIKRFSGGGTVVVDKNTVFNTFLCNTEEMNHVLPYPREIMGWTGEFYDTVFNHSNTGCGNEKFRLHQDDYIIGNRKFGGNAQSITKGRWLHHTSFLWDFDQHCMLYLQQPEKQPEYRGNRSHLDFLCKLKDRFKSKEEFYSLTEESLHRHFTVVETHGEESVAPLLEESFRKATKFLPSP